MTTEPPATHRILSPGAATLAVVVAAIGFSSIAISTVIATRDGTPLTTVVIGRFLLAAVILFPLAGGARGLAIGRRHALRIVGWGGGGQAVVNLLNLSALAFLPAATAVFLFYTFPAWVAVIAAVRGTERIGASRVLALLLSLAGIAIIIGAPGAQALSPVGAALSLAGALVYAMYIPVLRALQIGTNATIAIFYIAIGTCVTLLVYGAVFGQLERPTSAATLSAIGWLAVVPTVVAMQLFLRGLGTLGPVRTAIVSTVEPFSAALLAAIILREPLTIPTLVGGALIAGAVVLLQRPDRFAVSSRTASGDSSIV